MTGGDITYSRRGRVVTRTGIVIGGAYTKPAPRVVSADAAHIQRALLARRPGLGARLVDWLESNAWIAYIAGF